MDALDVVACLAVWLVPADCEFLLKPWMLVLDEGSVKNHFLPTFELAKYLRWKGFTGSSALRFMRKASVAATWPARPASRLLANYSIMKQKKEALSSAYLEASTACLMSFCHSGIGLRCFARYNLRLGKSEVLYFVVRLNKANQLLT